MQRISLKKLKHTSNKKRSYNKQYEYGLHLNYKIVETYLENRDNKEIIFRFESNLAPEEIDKLSYFYKCFMIKNMPNKLRKAPDTTNLKYTPKHKKGNLLVIHH